MSASLTKLLKGVAVTALVITYPVIVFLLSTHGFPWLGSTIVIALLIWRLRKHRYAVALIVGILATAIAAGVLLDPALVAKLVPVGIHIGLFSVFWQSLKTTPLIERFARLDFPDMPPEICRYVRRLTQVWAGFFAFNAVFCLILALRPDDGVWALYNGLIIYLLIAALFVGEIIWRKIRFPGLQTPPFKESLAKMMQYGRQVNDWK